jgi:hypothetical protein
MLTSEHTFSGAEQFSYNLKNLKRATLVGETTQRRCASGRGPSDRRSLRDRSSFCSRDQPGVEDQLGRDRGDTGRSGEGLRRSGSGGETGERESPAKTTVVAGAFGRSQNPRGIRRNFSMAIFALHRSRGDCSSKRMIASSNL